MSDEPTTPPFDRDEKLYAKMAAPYATAEEASAAIQAFAEAVYRLRRKHRIPEVTVIASAYHGSGEAVAAVVHRGDAKKQTPLLAWALGKSEAFDARLAKAQSDVMRAAGRRESSPSQPEPHR